jgi:hypothetical protein
MAADGSTADPPSGVGADDDQPTPLADRARLVGRAAAVGVVAGVALALALAVFEGPGFAGRKSFAVGAVLLGFGLLGWSGSIMAGEGFESMRAHLDVSSDWTERRSRRAMARVGGLGGGWMVGASIAAAVLA